MSGLMQKTRLMCLMLFPVVVAAVALAASPAANASTNWNVQTGGVWCSTLLERVGHTGLPFAGGTNTTNAYDYQTVYVQSYAVQLTTGSGWITNPLGPQLHTRIWLGETIPPFSANLWVNPDGSWAQAGGFNFPLYSDTTAVYVFDKFQIYDYNTKSWYSTNVFSARVC